MPEGPEAHVMAEDLSTFLFDGLEAPRFLESVEFLSDGKHFTPEVFRHRLIAGERLPLLNLVAYGKKVVFCFGRDAGDEKPSAFLSSFLGMGGLWQLRPSGHARLKLTFSAAEGEAEPKILYFNDTRGTGRVKACLDWDEALKDVGPDVLSGDVTRAVWAEALNTSSPVCLALVDQGRLSGIGNYLRADILYRAGVAPQRPASGLSTEELKLLFDAAKELMSQSMEVGGHSLQDYFRLDGRKGEYQPLVYCRASCPLGHRVTFSLDRKKRKCYFCPHCQH